MGGSRPNQNDYVFVILVTHPKSCIETTDRGDFGGKPSEKNSGIFLAWAEPDPKQHFFAFLGYPSTILRTADRKQFYPELKVPMESRDSEGVPFASLESLWPGIWHICRPLNGAEKWPRDHYEN